MPIIRQNEAPLEEWTGEGRNAELGPYTARLLSDAGGLTQFGAFVETLKPGARSSHQHWHEREDEFVYVLAGTVTLLEGETASDMRPGDAATFKAGWRLGIVSKTGRTRMSPISSSAPARRTRWCITPRRICC